MPTPSTPIVGSKLTLKFGSPAVDYKCDVTNVVMDNEDDDVTTFCDAEAGGAKRWFFNIDGIQSTDEASLWTYCWEHSGEEVAFTFAPHANDVPTPDEPHFIGTVKIGPKPPLGGPAQVRGKWSFNSRWEIVGEPVLDDGSES